MIPFKTFAVTIPILLIALTFFGAQAAEPVVDVTMTVDFGKDQGQNFGALFEGRDEAGRLVAGAGFGSAFNTYHRGERNKVQFFVRPTDKATDFEIEPFTRPGPDSSSYIYDLSGDMFFRGIGKSAGLHVWDEPKGTWEEAKGDAGHGWNVATVRGRRLEWANNQVLYDGRTVFTQPEGMVCRFYYYGQGHLFFYRQQENESGESVKSVVAIPWSPYDEPGEVTLAQAKSLDIRFLKEFPYAWGQLGDEVLNCSNWGGLYAFDGREWKTLVEPDEKTSYQIYSMINYGDRLLMAQYPSGFLIEYDGERVQILSNWPPVPPAASTGAREAQTTRIYRGELFVGVWPWAELWRLDPDAEEWASMGRLFTHPEVHSDPVHPYQTEAKAAGTVINNYGQRLTSMVPYRDGLVMGTSWKGASRVLEPDQTPFLTDEERAEYGALHRLEMPGNLAATIEWKDQPTTLRFILEEGRMLVIQDGERVAESEVDPALFEGVRISRVDWGRGVFGPLVGELVSTKSE